MRVWHIIIGVFLVVVIGGAIGAIMMGGLDPAISAVMLIPFGAVILFFWDLVAYWDSTT